MENQHLTYFKVENFKKFDSLEVKDIGQFNLIVGDNNVGKTCLLEALLFDFHAKSTLSAIHFTFDKRNIKIPKEINYSVGKEDFNYKNNLIGLIQKDKSLPITITKVYDENTEIFQIENLINFNPVDNEDTDLFIDEVDLFQYKGINQLSKNWLVFKKTTDLGSLNIEFLCDITSSYYKDFYYYLDYFPFIKIDDFKSDKNLLFYYKEIVKNPTDEQKIIDLISKIFDDVKIIRFSILDFFNKEEYLQIATSEKMDYHPINEYGDGFIRVISIIFELLYNKKKYLLIDEFETGIHYSKQVNFWVNILSVCKELDVQLFATTHSKECIEAFVEASKEIEEKDIRLIRLQENKDKSIKAICYKEEYLDYIVESNTEER